MARRGGKIEMNCASAAHIDLRLAGPSDAELVFQWRNDPFIVARSSLQSMVAWDEHQAWFARSIASHNQHLLFIVELGGTPIGLVRYDRRTNDDAEVAAYLLEAYTGRGLGVAAIREGCSKAFERWSVDRIVACVRHDNPRGYKGFSRAGFVQAEAHCPPDHDSLVLLR